MTVPMLVCAGRESKSVAVPFIPSLESLSYKALGDTMELHAAREYIDCINWPKFPYKPIVAVDLAWSDAHIFIRYFVRSEGLKALYTEFNDPVSGDSCVEFFVKDPDSPWYYSFEFNCIGTCLARRRTCPKNKESLLPQELSRIIVHTSLERQAFPEQKGIASWELIVGVPFDLMGLDPANLPAMLRANFQACANYTSKPYYVSWSPIFSPTPNFHLPEFFGELHLVRPATIDGH